MVQSNTVDYGVLRSIKCEVLGYSGAARCYLRIARFSLGHEQCRKWSTSRGHSVDSNYLKIVILLDQKGNAQPYLVGNIPVVW